MPDVAFQNVAARALREQLPSVLPEFLIPRRWFGGKSRKIYQVEVLDVVPLESGPLRAFIVLARVNYATGPAETYSLPLAILAPEASTESPHIRIQVNGAEVIFHDALAVPPLQEFLLRAILNNESLSGDGGVLHAASTGSLWQIAGPAPHKLSASVMRAEQSNTSISFGGRLIFKWFRRLENGINPDVEIGVFLTEKTEFRNVPQVAGFMEYSGCGMKATAGLLQAYVPNQGDAWQFTLNMLAEYYGRMKDASPPQQPGCPLLSLAEHEIPAEARRRIGPYLDSAAQLGLRTAELHSALASGTEPAFAPEPFDARSGRDLAQSAVGTMNKLFPLLRERADLLPASSQQIIVELLAAEPRLKSFFSELERLEISAQRTRIHGDYHLGQVLYTGSDFMIIDFEGEPARSLEERRRKRSPLQDVAGMLRSFDYAAWAPLLDSSLLANGKISGTALQGIVPWAAYWKDWVSAAFLRSYLMKAGATTFIPKERRILATLLDAYLVDKALYELGYEVNNRPNWLPIPLNGIAALLKAGD
jgi:trehalose synthase-fused probable maltokinase